MRKAALLLAAASLVALPQVAQARVFVGVGFGFGGPVVAPPPPVYYAPPPYYYAPPPVVAYAPPAFTPAPYAAPPGTTCATARFSCPMSQPGIIGGGCTCPVPGGSASGVIR